MASMSDCPLLDLVLVAKVDAEEELAENPLSGWRGVSLA